MFSPAFSHVADRMGSKIIWVMGNHDERGPFSAALFGEITLKNGVVEQSNFHDYPVVRMNQSPAIDITLVQSGAKPGGIGEPVTAMIGPAVANAVFAGTGKRLRKLPLRLA